MNTENNKFKRTRYTCFFTYVAMAAIFCLPSMLFVTFREKYGISYTLLGTLVLVNFTTQFIVDLIFTFFSKHFNIKKTIRTMPLITCIGMVIYAVVPNAFPEFAYVGLVIGTVVFSVAAGLCEVLLSPLVASLPSDNPNRDMSLLHSLYAYGVLTVVLISSAFFKLFGTENWMYLMLFFAGLSVVSFVLFSVSPIPLESVSGNNEKSDKKQRGKGLFLCVLCIFLGSAAENSMTNWISGYMENALGISKSIGDIVGIAVFAVLLGLGRSLYAKYGKNISKVLLVSMIGAVFCYLTAGLCTNVILSAVACVMTGLCTSLLWPGTLILMEEEFPSPGVAAYALMAAGGDFGGSLGPQLLGIVVDKTAATQWALSLGERLSMSPEQIGMKTGMLVGAIFPVMGVLVLVYMIRYFKKNERI